MYYLDFEELNVTNEKIIIIGNKKIVKLPQYSKNNIEMSFKEEIPDSLEEFKNKNIILEFCSNEGLIILFEDVFITNIEVTNNIVIDFVYKTFLVNNEERKFFNFKSVNQVMVFYQKFG